MVELLRSMVGPFSVSEFRQKAGISRKHAVPFLEYADRESVTMRSGDLRTVRNQGGQFRADERPVSLPDGGVRVPGGLLGLQNRWGVDRSPAGSIPVRLRQPPLSEGANYLRKIVAGPATISPITSAARVPAVTRASTSSSDRSAGTEIKRPPEVWASARIRTVVSSTPLVVMNDLTEARLRSLPPA